MSSEAQPIFDVFLSHSHVDAELVEGLALIIKNVESFNVWLDKWELIPGEHWQQAMAKGLQEAKTCAVCIGRETPKGWFKEEIERALNRHTKDPNFRVIPVILPGADKSIIDDFLELRTWIEFKEDIDDEVAIHQIVCGIKGIPPGSPPISIRPKPGNKRFKDKLIQLRHLRTQNLIDDEIALEYQRRILDLFIEIEE